MKKLFAIVAVSGAICGLYGCSSSGQQSQSYGDKKEDWAKTAPPSTWRGPGQPAPGSKGGPPASALQGPGGPPSGAKL